ncbi:MAG: hypothetical protein PSX81_01565 [bacterium]|nr:hypothetical protein [bacterium]
MKEFKLAKRWAILVYIIGTVFICLFAVLAISPFWDHNNGSKDISIVTIPISLIIISVMSIAIREAAIGRFVIADTHLFMKDAIHTRKLQFDDIKGYKTDDRYIYIIPKSKKQRTIKVSSFLKGKHEIIAWLGEHFDDLDLLQRMASEDAIMTNPYFGKTETERENNLEKTRTVTSIINWIGGAIGVWTFLFADPYELSIITCILTPIIAITIIRISKGMIALDEDNNSIHPNLFIAIFLPCIAIFWRALMDYEILRFSNIWTPCNIIVASLLGLIYIGGKRFDFKEGISYFMVLFMAVLFYAYAYGSMVTLNGYYDKSATKTYRVRVIYKSVIQGKRTSYHFDLEPWGELKEKNQVTVTKELYEKIAVQNTVQVNTKEGFFHIPWYFISE